MRFVIYYESVEGQRSRVAETPETNTKEKRNTKMNKTITAAYNAVLANPTDTALVTALRDLAVPKFKTIHGKVKSAVKSVNRHIGEGKGTPNRAKMSEAIGLREMIGEFAKVAKAIAMLEMADDVAVLLSVIDEIEKMRTARTYTHIAYLPDFLTVEEKREKAVRDAKQYLVNIIGAVNRAAKSVNAHINSGDFDPNTFKIAKAIGYADEIAALKKDFTALVAPTEDFALELAICDVVGMVIGQLKAEKAADNKNLVGLIPDYEPFANEGRDEDEVYEDFEPTDEE